MKPLIIGEAPNRNGDPARPLGGACGRRLADLCGITPREFARRFQRVNVLAAWPGAQSIKGATFPMSAARTAASRLRRRFVAGRIVIVLGRRVARAFEVDGEYFEPQRVAGATIVIVPHPSGVNRWYNSRQHERLARRRLSAIAAYAARDAR